jgi:hypothetical protein
MPDKNGLRYSEKAEMILKREKTRLENARNVKTLNAISKIKNFVSRFNKKNNYIYLVLFNVFVIYVTGYVISSIAGPVKTAEYKGFKYRLSKNRIDEQKQLSINIQIKNTLKKDNSLDFNKIRFRTVRDEREIIYEKEIILSKTLYKIDEAYSENVIINNPSKGKYSCVLNYGEKLTYKIGISFELK